MELLVGKVTHYYDKIGVAIVHVENQPLKLGDTLKFQGHDQEFIQAIVSMQVEHQQVKEVSPGTVVGIKVDKTVKVNDRVMLVG